jgi:hypothetical protein
MDMFRQIAPHGVVNKKPMHGRTLESMMDAPDGRTSSRPVSFPDMSLDGGAAGVTSRKYTNRGSYIGNLVSSAILSLRSKGNGGKSRAASSSPVHESRRHEYHGDMVSGGPSNDTNQEGIDKSHVSSAAAFRVEGNHTKGVLEMDNDNHTVEEDGDVELAVRPAVVPAAQKQDTQLIHEAIKSISPTACPLFTSQA